MALFALHQGVRTDQREAVVVVPDRFQRCLPTLHGVALRAVGAELAAMDVGVAVGALRAHILENHARMALTAAHALVHAPERIAGEIVIEIGLGADGLPA